MNLVDLIPKRYISAVQLELFADELLVPMLVVNLLPTHLTTDTVKQSVAVAQGNVHCLIETETMSKGEALSMAQAFIASDGISDKARDEVTSRPEFSDLMNAYIADQGGCQALVKQLQQ